MKNPKSLYILTAVIALALIAPAVICALLLRCGGLPHASKDDSSSENALVGEDTGSTVKGSGFVIVIDAGHGGYDPGKVSPDGVNEKDINLSIAQKLSAALKERGHTVFMTRDCDMSLSEADASHKKSSDLAARVALAQDTGAMLYLSIHQNSYSAEYVHGAQVFYYSTSADGKLLAESIQSRLISDADPDNTRNAKGNSEYMVLTDSPCTAVIIECGFLSNPAECARLCDEAYQQTLSDAIASGVQDWIAARR